LQEHKYNVYGSPVDRIEFDRYFQFCQQSKRSLQIRQPGMRNGDPVAYSRRSEFLPLERVRRNLTDTEAKANCRLGRQILQQQTLV
jgi:hypothetical protein